MVQLPRMQSQESRDFRDWIIIDIVEEVRAEWSGVAFVVRGRERVDLTSLVKGVDSYNLACVFVVEFNTQGVCIPCILLQ